MKVNEIFYSIQGEGRFTGTASVFIRFSGCNLNCDFCDTIHKPFKEISEDEILEEVKKYPTKHVVITGGEPYLQLTQSLIKKLHDCNKFIQVETNGTINKDDLNIDWVTCSPKFQFCQNAELKLKKIDELKVVYSGQDLAQYESIKAKEFYLQPCNTHDDEKNKEIISKTINYIKSNSKWKLSLQTQNILKVQ